MPILLQSASISSTSPPVLLLPAPPKRLALPAPKIAGYLPAPAKCEKRVIEVEIANPLKLINIYKDPDAWWAEFERLYGRVKTIEEMDAEIEAKHPGMVAFIRGAIAS